MDEAPRDSQPAGSQPISPPKVVVQKPLWAKLQNTASEDESWKTVLEEETGSSQMLPSGGSSPEQVLGPDASYLDAPPLRTPLAAQSPTAELAGPGDDDADQEVWMYTENDGSWQMLDEKTNAKLVATTEKWVTVT